ISLIHRRGETVIEVVGHQDIARGTRLERDSIFRIASMSKPITAVAAMILVEEGKLRLDEPVDRLLPELADRQVLKDIGGELDDTVPANRAISLRDLLTFRMGFGMVMAPPDQFPIQKAMTERQIMGLKPPTPHDPDAWMKELGALPLMHQPGERWMYHTGSDVLGVLIARASGMGLEAFLEARIFEPLGMKDTGFHVAKKQLGRLTTCYSVDPKTSQLQVYDDGAASQWSSPPVFPAGGGGMVSTVDDYLAFGQMMLNQGKLGKERILSRPTVAAMTTDQLTPQQKAASPFFPGFWDNRGWGLGVSMITRRDGVASSPGRFGWDGAFSTSWSSDPAEDMIGILMTQRLGFGPSPAGFFGDFWTLAYQAIDD
ncbi:MAG TPA: serine hydrolase domain-containing protein, partial [Caulobacteraceae bacterium]